MLRELRFLFEASSNKPLIKGSSSSLNLNLNSYLECDYTRLLLLSHLKQNSFSCSQTFNEEMHAFPLNQSETSCFPPKGEAKPPTSQSVNRENSDSAINLEKDGSFSKMKKTTDFDLDLVKRRVRKPNKISIMEQKNRDRVRKAMFNVLFFPFHLSWWRKRVSNSRPHLYKLVVLYFLHAVSVFRELLYKPTETPVDYLELMMPFMLLIVMSVIMGQAAAVQTQSRISHIRRHNIVNGINNGNSNGSQTPLTCSPLAPPPSPSVKPISVLPIIAKPESKLKVKRKSSRTDNDSMNEFEDDQDQTASSDSGYSDSSSSSEETRRRRSLVAVRRSSLLGTPGAPSENINLVHVSNQQQHSQQNQVTATILKTISPRNFQQRRSRNIRFKPTKQKPEISIDPPDTNFTSEDHFDDADDSDTEEEDSVQKLNIDSTAEKESSFRNRFFSQSMEDLLDTVKSVQWSENGPAKVMLTPGQIRAELERKVMAAGLTDHYRSLAYFGAIVVSMIPIMFRSWMVGQDLACSLRIQHEYVNFLFSFSSQCNCSSPISSSVLEEFQSFFSKVFGSSILDILGVVTSCISTFFLSWTLLSHAAGALDTFKRRYLYAKFFSKLTSSRKAKRYDLPYFRLHKVDHIKAWLSLRSKRMDLDLENIGPYRASDTIAYLLFMIAIFLVGVVSFRAIQNISNQENNDASSKPNYIVPSTLADWFLVGWALILAIYVQRIMDLASKTHEKYQNTSVLLTEELNIHMRLLRKPEKKDELAACNQMLKVAGALIKELEGGKNKKGQNAVLVLDPWLYSIVRVILLSALGALSSDLFGFRVRFWKI